MFLFLIISFFLLLGTLLPKEKQNLYLLISFIILFILSAFRGENVGTDTINYKDLFNSFQLNIDWIRLSIEPGWLFLNDVIIFLGGEYRHLIILSSFLTLASVFFVAKKYSLNPMLSILAYYLLYFYFYSFNISRQLLAVSIVLVAFLFLIKNRIFLFAILIFFASLFHSSALICLLLILVNKLSGDKYILSLLSFLSGIVGLFGYQLISKLAKFSDYESYVLTYEHGNLLGNSLFLVIYQSFLIFILFTVKKVTLEVKIFCFYIIFMSITIRIPFADRLILYFAAFQILFFPYYLLKQANFDKNSRSIAFFLILMFLYIIFFRVFGAGEILPYNNILF